MAAESPSSDSTEYRAYARRWLYLLVVCLVNFSNAMTWITFANINFYTKAYYDNKSAPLLFNIVFMAVSIPMGFVATWVVDRFGLRTGTLLGSWLNCIGNIIRVVGCLGFMPVHLRFPVSFAGQIIAAAAQPFVMFIPTKLAAFWFPESQRAIANTMASMSNPLGIAAMYSLSPVFVNHTHPRAFPLLNSVCAGLAVATALLSLSMTSSKPPTPVSSSKNEDIEQPPFFQGVKTCLTTKPFVILSMCIGGGVGLFNALYNNLQPALCAKGYSSTFSGLMGSLLIISGLFGSAISGVFVDRTKMFEETLKVCFGLAALSACGLSILVAHTDQHALISVAVFCLGAFGFAMYPIGLEMGVEATYPVAEATSSGIIIMLGQIEGVVFVLITQLVTRLPNAQEMRIQTCITDGTQTPKDVPIWTMSFVVWNVFIVVLLPIFVFFFRPVYKRLAFERARALRMQVKETDKMNIPDCEDGVPTAPEEPKQLEQIA